MPEPVKPAAIEIPSFENIEREICECEYYEFFLRAWPILEPTTPLQNNWHIKYLCDVLQSEVERIARKEKKTQDIIINIPPRSLKSSITTICLNAWAWARFPAMRFIGVSYGADISIELGLKTRRLLESDWYQKNWGKRVRFSPDQNTKGIFENSAGGIRKNIGVGGALTGSGADILLIDDPQNPEEAHSEADRTMCIRWFKETAYSRLNDQSTGLRVVIMQRLHQEDLTGWILANQPGAWRHICLPACADYVIQPAELAENYKEGLFFPTRFTPEVLAQAKETLGSYGFAGQMGQAPAPKGGGIFKLSWLKYYSVEPAGLGRIFWSWDCAVKSGEDNDYSVGLKCAEFAGGVCVLDLVRGKWEYPDLKRMIQLHGEKQEVQGILIEDKSSGQQVIQDLKQNTRLNVLAFESDRDKVMRAQLASPTVEAGRVWLPEKSVWLADFLTELSLFPKVKHDDQVDALTQIILHLKNYSKPAMIYSGATQTKPVKNPTAWDRTADWMR